MKGDLEVFRDVEKRLMYSLIRKTGKLLLWKKLLCSRIIRRRRSQTAFLFFIKKTTDRSTNDLFMASFDVKSLFTNIPLQETIEIL